MAKILDDVMAKMFNSMQKSWLRKSGIALHNATVPVVQETDGNQLFTPSSISSADLSKLSGASALTGTIADAISGIISYGSNDNGEYWRFESGLQICVMRVTHIGVFSSEWQGFHVKSFSADFPVSFAETPAITAFGYGGSAHFVLKGGAKDATINNSGELLIARPDNPSWSDTQYKACIIAVGKWK